MKIGICGSQSVGKSTLIKALSKDPFFKGFKIGLERTKQLKAKGIPLNQKSTFKGQLVFFAERAMELMAEDMITDRTALDVYAFGYVSKEISKNQKLALKAIKDNLIKEYDMIFYIPIIDEIPLEDNGLRDTDEDFRKEIDVSIQKEFAEGNDYNWFKINAVDVESRVREIILLIKRHLK